ncbi:MAG: DUF4443 domain-containing protein [Nitrososphaeraceae archaeon]
MSRRKLSFDFAHVFKTLQLAKKNGRISRDMLKKELLLGEGSIKTLIKYLKQTEIIKTTNGGTVLTTKGENLIAQLLSCIPYESNIPKSSITLGKFNHAILVKNASNAIKFGIEQRDEAIKSGAIGATTLIFKNNKFLIPSSNYNVLDKEPQIHRTLFEKLKPENNDIIIIGSDNQSKKNAELASKNAAIFTILNHLKH